MKRINRAAADLVKGFHALFVIYAVLGVVLVPVAPWTAWVHVPVVLWAWGINIGGWTCPLTPLENYFRARAGGAGYSGGFIEHYLRRFGLDGMERRVLERRVGWVILIINAAAYGLVLALAP